MSTLRRIMLMNAAALAAVALLGGCGTSISLKEQPKTLSAPQIAAIVNSPDRSDADRENDQRRKPEALLGFIGIEPGITALDVSAGGGYTTELLARAIGPGGLVYGQVPPRRLPPVDAAPVAPEGGAPAAEAAPPPAPRPPGAALIERAAKLQTWGIPAAAIGLVVQAFENPVPLNLSVSRLDLVTLMFNYHDLGHLGVDRGQMNRAIFRGLKPGGLYVIADHSGRPGTGITESGTLHRVEQALVRQEVEAAGFKLVAEGQFLRNPNDPRDRNTPEPPQPKDEFVMKFVKP